MGRSQQHAFTLIELLVVVSIIALLIALLLPILAQAREAAHKVICVANSKQMVLGVLHYAEDHASSLTSGLDGIKHWPEILFPWVKNYQIYD